MKTSRSVSILLFFFFVQLPYTAAQGHPNSSTQTHSSAEDAGVERPVAIPEDVSALLEKDEMVRGAMEDQNIPADKLPTSWFSASAIHLSSPDKTGFIVVGEPPLSSANVSTFGFSVPRIMAMNWF
jgi:hypothetical protein